MNIIKNSLKYFFYKILSYICIIYFYIIHYKLDTGLREVSKKGIPTGWRPIFLRSNYDFDV